MDAIELEVLVRELAADRAVLGDAAGKAATWVALVHAGRLEACAYELNRFYSVVERMLERICEAFENHFERRHDYHERLLRRLALDLPGIRPAFLPATSLDDLRELRRFRHLVRHAYDLTLRDDRVRELVALAGQVELAIDGWCAAFVGSIRAEMPPR